MKPVFYILLILLVNESLYILKKEKTLKVIIAFLMI
jgi:multisubunit Na+/H+ antiporter MnhC subunit